ncbi:MAG: general secretion pathway protein GspK, partial [Armatimonadetes bacterium]|nr:general secretion pathway protein GspK [Armatimonadota bacterium]
ERGKVNVNTAPLEVLAALPGSSEALADAIIVRREAQPFLSLGDVVTMLVDLPDGPAVFDQMIDHVRTKSSSFVIESMGRTSTGRTHRTLSALVRRTPDAVYVIRQVERDQPLPPLDEGAQQSVAIARR